jgi:hypothetical protein
MIIAAARPQIASPQATMIIQVIVPPFGAAGGGGGASDGAGSNSKEMALISAAASAGVAWRRAFKSGGASDAATGNGTGWAGRSARAVAPCPSVTALASSTRTFGLGRNARQLGPNQHILPATTSACQSPRAPPGLYLRQSNADALWPAQIVMRIARSSAGKRINIRAASGYRDQRLVIVSINCSTGPRPSSRACGANFMLPNTIVRSWPNGGRFAPETAVKADAFQSGEALPAGEPLGQSHQNNKSVAHQAKNNQRGHHGERYANARARNDADVNSEP